MIVKIANKQLKQPIELSIPDADWEIIRALPSQDERNQRLLVLATKHIAKNGYGMGFCDQHKRVVTLDDCMKCGVSKGWGRGPENFTRWEECKHEHINYDFSPARVLTNTVKDQKIVAKMNDQSEAEARRDKQTFAETPRESRPMRQRDAFEKASDEIMDPIREKENNL